MDQTIRLCEGSPHATLNANPCQHDDPPVTKQNDGAAASFSTNSESERIGNMRKGSEPVGDDQALMRLLQQDDEAAFEQIVRQWEQPMLNFFYRAVGDLDLAEDLRQDLFVRLYTYRASFRGNGTFRAWFYQLATNVLRTHFRRVKTFIPLEDKRPDGESESDAADIASDQPSVGEIAQRRDRERVVREMLAALSPEDREALVLRFYEGLRYPEICQALDIAETSAKSRVYRAIERLRNLAAERRLCASDLL